nr:hypothetical protein [Tanacetum cinerariifolium]
MDATMKHMASSFAKLEKFKGVDFRRWQKKMHFMLSSMSVVYVLTTPMPEDRGENPTVKQVRKRAKWDNDDYVYSGLILNDFKHTLKHLKEELTLIELGSHLCIEESLRVQDSDKPKGNNVAGPSVVNMVEHNNSFRYNDNKGKRKHHDTRANPNKKPKVTCWKCGKPGHLKKDCKAGNVGNKANGSSTKGSEDGSSNPLKGQTFMSTFKLNDSIIWHARLGHVHFKRMQDMSKDGLILTIDMDTKKWNKKYFVKFIDDAFRFYVIEPNNLVAINSIIESKDAIFDEHRFSSVPRPSQRSLVKGTEDYGGSVVSERVTDEIAQQSKPQLRKSKRHKTPKDFGHEFQLYLIEGIRDEVSDQHSYCFNVEDDPKTFDEAIKSRMLPYGNNLLLMRWTLSWGITLRIYYFNTYAPVARISTIRLLIVMASIHNLIIHQMDVKTAFVNEELEEEVYMNEPLGFIMPGNENKVCKLIKSFKFDASGEGVIICLYVDDMLIFGTDQVQVDLTKEFLSSRFSMKDMGEAYVILGIRIKHESNGIAISQSHYIEKVLKKFNYFDCTPVSTPLDTCEKLMPNRGLAVSQLEYSRVLGCLMYAMTCTRPNIAFVVGKLSSYTILEGYTDASWISNTEDDSSTSGWVFLLGGAAGKEAEWLKNLLLEIPLWVKPMAPISINCDSATTLAKAISQMYNEKSKHLCRAEAHILQIIPRMCLEPVVRRMKLLTCQWPYQPTLTKTGFKLDFIKECLLQAKTPDKQKIIIEGMIISWENIKRMAKAANARFNLVKEAAGDLREAGVSPVAAADAGKGVPGVSPAATKDY